MTLLTRHEHDADPQVVQAARAAGFVVDQTGGNCVAYASHAADGWYLWLTDIGGTDLPDSMDEPDSLWGVYEPTGEAQWVAQGTGTARAIIANRDAIIETGRRLYRTLGISEDDPCTLDEFLSA